MDLDQLIEALRAARAAHGNLPVIVQNEDDSIEMNVLRVETFDCKAARLTTPMLAIVCQD